MCGIVGIAKNTTLNKGEVAAFKEMVYLDALRGPHSTGLLSFDGKAATVYKRALCASDFLQLNATTSLLNAATGKAKVLLGHNRWATKGAINDDNAHPFSFGDVIGVHNGSLNSWGHHAKGHEVDSAALYAHISQEKDPVDALEQIDGAYALVWVNTKDNTLHMVRNDERTLYIHETNNGILWASEEWMLDAVVERTHIAAYKGDHRLWYPEPLPPLTYKVYSLDDMKVVRTQEVREYVKKPQLLASSTSSGGHTGVTTTEYEVSRNYAIDNTPDLGTRLLLEFDGQAWRSTSASYGNAVGFISTDEFWVDVRVVAMTKEQFKPGIWEVEVYRKEYDPFNAMRAAESGVTLICRAIDAEYLGTKEECDATLFDDGEYKALGYWVKKPGGESRTEELGQCSEEEEVVQTTSAGVVYRGYNGIILTPKAWSNLTRFGCGQCGCPLTVDNTVWHSIECPICETCCTILTGDD